MGIDAIARGLAAAARAAVAALGTMASQAANAVTITGGTIAGLTNLRIGASNPVGSEVLTVVGGNGLMLRTQFNLTSADTVIATGASILLYIRDTTRGGSALVTYENDVTPNIVWQGGVVTFVTGAPSGTQIKLGPKTGNLGVAASMASGQSTTINVMILSTG